MHAKLAARNVDAIAPTKLENVDASGRKMLKTNASTESIAAVTDVPILALCQDPAAPPAAQLAAHAHQSVI